MHHSMQLYTTNTRLYSNQLYSHYFVIALYHNMHIANCSYLVRGLSLLILVNIIRSHVGISA